MTTPNSFLDLCDECKRAQLRAHSDCTDLPELCTACKPVGFHRSQGSPPSPTFSFGQCPAELIKLAATDQCPDGYPMVIRDKAEWQALAAAWNQGIDSHLEAITERSEACSGTGSVNVHPEELHTLLRRLYESGGEDAWSLRSGILTTLGIEEI